MKVVPWCFRAQYPGKKQFWFGSCALPHDARLDEVEKALKKLWHETFPFDPPATVEMKRGSLIFVPEE